MRVHAVRLKTNGCAQRVDRFLLPPKLAVRDAKRDGRVDISRVDGERTGVGVCRFRPAVEPRQRPTLRVVRRRALRIHSEDTVARVDRISKTPELAIHDRQVRQRIHIVRFRAEGFTIRGDSLVVARVRLMEDADVEIRGRIPGIGANGVFEGIDRTPFVALRVVDDSEVVMEGGVVGREANPLLECRDRLRVTVEPCECDSKSHMRGRQVLVDGQDLLEFFGSLGVAARLQGCGCGLQKRTRRLSRSGRLHPEQLRCKEEERLRRDRRQDHGRHIIVAQRSALLYNFRRLHVDRVSPRQQFSGGVWQ